MKINSCSLAGYSCVLHRFLYLLAKFRDRFCTARIWTQSLLPPNHMSSWWSASSHKQLGGAHRATVRLCPAQPWIYRTLFWLCQYLIKLFLQIFFFQLPISLVYRPKFLLSVYHSFHEPMHLLLNGSNSRTLSPSRISVVQYFMIILHYDTTEVA